MPPDWTDLEVDLRIDDERRYVDSAVALEPGQRRRSTREPSGTGGCWSPTASATRAAAETVEGVLAKLDARRRRRRAAASREVREGRSEVVADVGPPGERARGVPPAPLSWPAPHLHDLRVAPSRTSRSCIVAADAVGVELR